MVFTQRSRRLKGSCRVGGHHDVFGDHGVEGRHSGFDEHQIAGRCRLPQRGVVTLATNVPGPRQPLRMMGRNIMHLSPIPPIALQLRTGIAMLTYADELAFGITADFDATPDVEELADGIERGMARLVAASPQ